MSNDTMTTTDNEIYLLKNNDGRNRSDLTWIEEFYQFLQGEVPEKLQIGRGHVPNLSKKQAMSVIWYLQERFPVLPDHIEQCYNCNGLFDTDTEGLYWETKKRHYCGSCDFLVPKNYDRGRR